MAKTETAGCRVCGLRGALFQAGLAISTAAVISGAKAPDPTAFEADRAWFHLERLVSFGERYTGSPGHAEAKEYMKEVLRSSGAQVKHSEARVEVPGSDPIVIENIMGTFGSAGKGRFLVGTHYDTRPWPDREEDESLHRVRGVIGANDGGAGVAVLLEVARILGGEASEANVDLVFFDAEEPLPKEFIPDGYFLGSKWFVRELIAKGQFDRYQAVVVIDVIGEKDGRVGLDGSSFERAPELAKRISRAMSELDPSGFRLTPQESIWDDHTAFQEVGVPAALLIDFDYPYMDTLQDTLDKIGKENLERVGKLILKLAGEME